MQIVKKFGSTMKKERKLETTVERKCEASPFEIMCVCLSLNMRACVCMLLKSHMDEWLLLKSQWNEIPSGLFRTATVLKSTAQKITSNAFGHVLVAGAFSASHCADIKSIKRLRCAMLVACEYVAFVSDRSFNQNHCQLFSHSSGIWITLYASSGIHRNGKLFIYEPLAILFHNLLSVSHHLFGWFAQSVCVLRAFMLNEKEK